MDELILFTVVARAPDGKYSEFMRSADERAIDEYSDIIDETVDSDWEVVKYTKHYQCVSTTPQVITRK